jgi:hypothetical protein
MDAHFCQETRRDSARPAQLRYTPMLEKPTRASLDCDTCLNTCRGTTASLWQDSGT